MKPCPVPEATARFPDAGAAGVAVKMLNGFSTPRLEAYRCRCGLFHVRPRRRRWWRR